MTRYAILERWKRYEDGDIAEEWHCLDGTFDPYDPESMASAWRHLWDDQDTAIESVKEVASDRSEAGDPETILEIVPVVWDHPKFIAPDYSLTAAEWIEWQMKSAKSLAEQIGCVAEFVRARNASIKNAYMER